MRAFLLDLDPATYRPHALHQGDRRWLETNCYVDVWIELLHALGHEPLATLGFTLRTELEADQWTFFKPPHADIDALYGIEVNELNLWSGLLEQTVAEVAFGRPVLIELDAWYLPDTRGTSYRTAHVKTTVAVVDIDPDAKRMGYFHNAGYHRLEGEDFDEVLRLDPARYDASHLPPYVEIAKLGAGPALTGAALQAKAGELLRVHMGRVPSVNPVSAYRKRFGDELARLKEGGADHFHAYAFAAFRQIGAAFELAADHLRWLDAPGPGRPDVRPLGDAAGHCESVSASAKSLQMKVARLALAKRTVDTEPELISMEAAWADAIGSLHDALA